MRYVEIDARNVLWENQKEFINELCNRANNEFVKKYIKTTIVTGIINDFPAELTKKSESQLPAWAKGKTNELYEIRIDANNKEKFFHYIDYLNTLPNAPIKIAFSDLPKKVAEWENEKVNADSIGKVKKVFTDGEFEWYQLLDGTSLKYETKYMQHCVGKGGYTRYVEDGDIIIYSLRKNNKPHATLDLRKDGDLLQLFQIKGKQNAPVVDKYRPYVITFLNHLNMNEKSTHYCRGDFTANNFVIQNNKIKDALKIKNWKGAVIYIEHAQKLLDSGVSLDNATITGVHILGNLVLNHVELNNVTFKAVYIKGKGKLNNCDISNSYLEDFEGFISGKGFPEKILNSKIKFDIEGDIPQTESRYISGSEITGNIKVTQTYGNLYINTSKLKNITGILNLFKLDLSEKSLISCPKLEINTELLRVNSKSKFTNAKKIKVDRAAFEKAAPYLPNNMEANELRVFSNGLKKPDIPKNLVIKERLESDCLKEADCKGIEGISNLVNKAWNDSYIEFVKR